MAKGPVLIELDDDTPPPAVDTAPPVPDTLDSGDTTAMQRMGQWVARRPSRLARAFWAVTAALLAALLSSTAWRFVTGWIDAQPIIGWAFAGLMGAFLALLFVIILRELAALARLGRIDALRHTITTARESTDLPQAKSAITRLMSFYKGRDDTTWSRARFDRLAQDQLDAGGLLDLAEREVMAPLDAEAARAVETAARQVATVTALVPLALADVVTALAANLRMIRQISEIYGGRAGTLGAWRLTRAVMGHLVATGAVAVGDDMLEPILGGSLLGKLSRRFGEGLVNGALTARVGVAAIEVCRPMPFAAVTPPKARDLVKGALTGLVARND